jgi:hypothetical protein
MKIANIELFARALDQIAGGAGVKLIDSKSPM